MPTIEVDEETIGRLDGRKIEAEELTLSGRAIRRRGSDVGCVAIGGALADGGPAALFLQVLL